MDNAITIKGKIEVLNYYKEIGKKIIDFLDMKEIATKNWIPNGPQLLKRGSKLEPLYIKEFVENCDNEFIKTRLEIEHLEEAKNKLNKSQIKIWQYFIPRKLSDFFYATNNEGAGKPIERIFFDIDRKERTKDDARKVCVALAEEINTDDKFNNLVGEYKMFLLYTGNSFHIYLLLKKKINQVFYDKNLQFSKHDQLMSFTGRWVHRIKESTGIKVIGGHEKEKNHINIDPSQTPSGKLARAPFSLHMKSPKEVDGVAIPVDLIDLRKKTIIDDLEKYNPDKVLVELDELAKKIPKPYS